MSLESNLVAFRMSVPRLRYRSAHHTPKWRDETLVRCAKSVILQQAQNRSKFPRGVIFVILSPACKSNCFVPDRKE